MIEYLYKCNQIRIKHQSEVQKQELTHRMGFWAARPLADRLRLRDELELEPLEDPERLELDEPLELLLLELLLEPLERLAFFFRIGERPRDFLATATGEGERTTIIEML